MNHFKISEQTLRKTMDYLVNRPWAEVNGIVNELLQVPKIEEPKGDESAPEEAPGDEQ